MKKDKQLPVCKGCGKPGHTKFNCWSSKKKASYKIKSAIISTKGKGFKQWMLTRKTWFRKNPPDADGYYWCYLKIVSQCKIKMLPRETTLDHVIPRSRRPDLRYNLSNIKPACWPCNEAKGSRVLEGV